MTTTAGNHKSTITPALTDPVSRRKNDDGIHTYIHRHGLATALTDAVARERGEVTHHLITENLDISPQAAEMIL